MSTMIFGRLLEKKPEEHVSVRSAAFVKRFDGIFKMTRMTFMSKINSYIASLSDDDLKALVKEYDEYEMTGVIGEEHLRYHITEFARASGHNMSAGVFVPCTMMMLSVMRELIKRS